LPADEKWRRATVTTDILKSCQNAKSGPIRPLHKNLSIDVGVGVAAAATRCLPRVNECRSMRECFACGILKNSSCSSAHRQQRIAIADRNSLPLSAAKVTANANDAATLSAAAETNVHGRNALSGPDVGHAGVATQVVGEETLPGDWNERLREWERFLERWIWRKMNDGIDAEHLRQMGLSWIWITKTKHCIVKLRYARRLCDFMPTG
jgi:hypothetical protein